MLDKSGLDWLENQSMRYRIAMTTENAIRHPMHPNSLANLNRKGRAKVFDSDKKKRYLTVTEDGWSGTLKAAQLVGCSSVSDLLEKIGRGNLILCASAENLDDRTLTQRHP